MKSKEEFKVIWSHLAKNELRNIINTIKKDNPGNAITISKKINTTVFNLSHFPLRGRHVPEFKQFGLMQYRELVISPWRIIYTIPDSDKKVFVLSVLDSRQNVEDILLNRLIRSNS